MLVLRNTAENHGTQAANNRQILYPKAGFLPGKLCRGCKDSQIALEAHSDAFSSRGATRSILQLLGAICALWSAWSPGGFRQSQPRPSQDRAFLPFPVCFVQHARSPLKPVSSPFHSGPFRALPGVPGALTCSRGVWNHARIEARTVLRFRRGAADRGVGTPAKRGWVPTDVGPAGRISVTSRSRRLCRRPDSSPNALRAVSSICSATRCFRRFARRCDDSACPRSTCRDTGTQHLHNSMRFQNLPAR